MKTIKTLLVVAGLLGSAQAMACDVYINVTNATGVTLDRVNINGPSFRYSDSHELEDGEDFTYHASGWLCHGKYSLDDRAGKPYCEMSGAHDRTLDMNSDGTGHFIILKEKSGTKCVVSKTK